MKALKTWYKNKTEFLNAVSKFKEELEVFKEYSILKAGYVKDLEDISVDAINLKHEIEKIDKYIEICDSIGISNLRQSERTTVNSLKVEFYNLVARLRDQYKKIPNYLKSNLNINYFFNEIPTTEKKAIKENLSFIEVNFLKRFELKDGLLKNKILLDHFNFAKKMENEARNSTFDLWDLKNRNKKIDKNLSVDLARNISNFNYIVNDFCQAQSIDNPDDISASLDYELDLTQRQINELIQKTFLILGSEIQGSVKDILKNNIFYRKGEFYSAQYDHYLCEPIIITSYPTTVYELILLVHEIGHAVHSKILSAKQKYVFSESDILSSEIFSQFFEVFFMIQLGYFQDSIKISPRDYDVVFSSYLMERIYWQAFKTLFEDEFLNSEISDDTDEMNSLYLKTFAEFYPWHFKLEKPDNWKNQFFILDSYYNHCYLMSFGAALNLAQGILSFKYSVTDLHDLLRSGVSIEKNNIYNELLDIEDMKETFYGYFSGIERKFK